MRTKIATLFLTFLLALSTLHANDCEDLCWEECYVPCWCGIFSAHLDFLYWRPCPDGIFTSNKARIDAVEGGEAFLSFDGRVRTKDLDPDLDPGFRLGFSYQCSCDSLFDYNLDWTSICLDASSSQKRDIGDDRQIVPFTAVFPNILGSGDSFLQIVVDLEEVEIEKISGDWDCDLNMIDLQLGYRMCFNNCLFFRPHFDIRLANIDQRFRVKTEGTRFLRDLPAGGFEVKERFENDFSGIGPRLGFFASWDIGCGFAFYTHMAGSLLYGEHDYDYRGNGVRFDPINPTYDVDDLHFKAHRSKYCTRVITDAGFGASWIANICCCDVLFKLGWEHHYFFNQSAVDGAIGYLILTKEENSSLSTQGLTLSAGITY